MTNKPDNSVDKSAAKRRILPVLVVVLAFAALGTAVAFIANDLGRFKQQITTLLSRQMPYELAIDGDLEIHLGGLITIKAEKIRLSNPAWEGQELLAKASRLHLVTDLWSWFKGPIIFNEIEVSQGRVNFEFKEDSGNNWTGKTDQDSGLNEDLNIILSYIQAQDIEVTIAEPRLTETLVIKIDELNQHQLASEQLKLRANGIINEEIFQIEGEYGTLANLIAGRNLTYSLSGNLGMLSISSEGRLDSLTRPERPEIQLGLSSPNVDRVTEMLSLEDLGDGDINVQLRTSSDANTFAIDVEIDLGAYLLDAEGAMSSMLDTSQVDINFSGSGPSFARITQLMGLDDLPDGVFEFSGSLVRNDSLLDINNVEITVGAARLYANGTLRDFPKLRDATLEVEITGQELARFRDLTGLPGNISGPFKGFGRLDRNITSERQLDLSIDVDGLALNARGTVGNNIDLTGSKLAITMSGPDVSILNQAYGLPLQTTDAFSISGDIELNSQDSVSLSNTIWRFGKNEIKLNGLLSYAPLAAGTDLRLAISGGNFSKAFKTVMPESKMPGTPYTLSTRLKVSPESFGITSGKIETAGHSLNISGNVGRTEDFSNTSLTYSAQGPDLYQIANSFSDLQIPRIKYQFTGKTMINRDDIRIENLEFAAMDGQGTLNATIGRPLASEQGNFELSGSGDDIGSLWAGTALFQPDTLAFDIDANGYWESELWVLSNADAQFGNTTIQAKGQFDRPPDLSNTQLEIKINSADISRLGLINGYRIPPNDFRLQGRFTGTPRSILMEQLSANSGKSSLTGRLEIILDEDIPRLDAQFQSSLLDIQPLWDYEKEAQSTLKDSDDRLIPQYEIPVTLLKQINARVKLDANELLYGPRIWRNFILNGEIESGRLEVSKFKADTPFGDFQASLSAFETTPETVKVSAELSGSDIYLNLAGKTTQQDTLAAPKYDGGINLTGQGKTTRELASTLTGNVLLLSEGGQINNTRLSLFYGDFMLGLLGTVNPFFKQEPFTNLSCSAIVLEINEGEVLAVPGIIAQTDKLNIVSNGKINLGTEIVDMNFRTSARRGLGISAGELINPYIRVGGTLSNPRLAIDKSSSLISGGAAVATAGLSIVATTVWNRAFRKKNPCEDIVNKYTDEQAADQ